MHLSFQAESSRYDAALKDQKKYKQCIDVRDEKYLIQCASSPREIR
jgi:hypothetical protein